MPLEPFVVSSDHSGQTLAAVLRDQLPGRSWASIRRLVATRQAKVNGELCLDPARRLKEGDQVEILDRPVPPIRQHQTVIIRHVDAHVVVVEKPAGIATVRHPAERDWPADRKALEPTLEDIVFNQIGRSGDRGKHARLRIVHRLDKETSGLVVFARTVVAERHLGAQFHAHTVLRRYLAVVPGQVPSQTIRSILVRDRGDGRRGSTTVSRQGKEAITHVEVVEQLRGYTVLACRLETGRTHQIRIHLAEQGHPICGEKVYNRKVGAEPKPDGSGAARLALHAAALGFEHPATGAFVQWETPLPQELQDLVNRLRGRHIAPADHHGDQVDR